VIKLAAVVGGQFITLSVHLCVQHDGREEARRTGLPASAETCFCLVILVELSLLYLSALENVECGCV